MTNPNKNDPIIIDTNGYKELIEQSKGTVPIKAETEDWDPNKLSLSEIAQLKELLASKAFGGSLSASYSADSEYPEFAHSTHAWAIFADNPQKRAGHWERFVGCCIILFQLFAYRLFAVEAIKDFQKGNVAVTINHADCIAAGGVPDDGNNDLMCDASFTNTFDAFVAYCMLGIFLAEDFLQAARAIKGAPLGIPMLFALLAGVEIVSAFLAASVAVSYNLFIGEVTDAVAVGVGLLFIRELSQKTYRGLKSDKTKQYRIYSLVLALLVIAGMIMDPLCAKLFAGYIQ